MTGHSTTDNNYFNANFNGYRASDTKVKSTDENIVYWGFLSKFGDYFIQEQNDTNGTYRFYKGSSDYTTAWAGRESLTYDYFDAIFGDI